MVKGEKNILNRLYLIAGCLGVFALVIVFKMFVIQFVHGDKYKGLADKGNIKNFVIPANRGNVYAEDGSLLATSVPKYDIRVDALTPTNKTFSKYVGALSDSLAVYYNKPASYFQNKLQKARVNKNRYLLLARKIGYADYVRFRNFPMLRLGAFKGGLIVEQSTKREHPMGGIAERTIGYERIDEKGNVTRPGIEGAFGEQYLRGTNGRRLKQKIGKGKWKPISDNNEIEPKDGYDVYSTLDVNIQDIAHHTLLKQLEKYKADHGCVVVMETKTGEIKAISNLGRTPKGNYYERLNYAVGESHEPGSTFKLMALIAGLEDKLIDTSDVVDTKKGVLNFFGKKVRDSKVGGYGKISVAKAFEVSSNTGIVQAINKAYKHQPKKFVESLYNMNLNQTLDLPIIGEGKPIIPSPDNKDRWSGIALQWMAFGYGVSFTPLQTLTFYNAIANGGEMVKPQFLKRVKSFNKTIVPFKKEVINPKICSEATLLKAKQLLKNVIEKPHGTANSLYSPHFSMAGKTGTCQKNYSNKDKLNYISSFVGFFPEEDPKYSCIVVIHEPDKSVGYYGVDVSGPVFKSIAQKIFINTPSVDKVFSLEIKHQEAEKEFEDYYRTAQKYLTIMPNVIGLPVMDAIALLENMGLKVTLKNGIGTVKKQSIEKGTKTQPKQLIVLTT